jgi:uncharacterized protein (TIGR03083 family)
MTDNLSSELDYHCATHVPTHQDHPILTAPLFEELDGKLVDLLESLSPAEWQLPTIVPAWTVKQIAAHLLDTALRRLSLARDGERGPSIVIENDRDLAVFVNGLNAKGVDVYGRLSPRVLISMTRIAVRDLHAYLSSLDPMSAAPWAVSWAGETRSENWFDIARELTERWHHQQQIRLAVDRPGIMTPRLYGPVLECFLRALPYAYRSVQAPLGTVLEVRISGDCGGAWRIRKDEQGWSALDTSVQSEIHATTTIPQALAWRIFTKGITRAEARPHLVISGDERIAAAVLDMIAIVA